VIFLCVSPRGVSVLPQPSHGLATYINFLIHSVFDHLYKFCDMQKTPIFLSLILSAFSAVSCVTSKTIENEKRMEEWLSNAAIPVTVMDQTTGPRCKPTLRCYTLIDATGKVHHAPNVRHGLPRVIPEDSTTLQPRLLERFLFGQR